MECLGLIKCGGQGTSGMFAGLLSKADAHFYLLQPFCRFGIFGLFKLYLHEIPNHNFYSIFLCESKKETDVAEIFSKFVSHLKSKDILCNYIL